MYPLDLEKGDPIEMRGVVAHLSVKEREVDRDISELTEAHWRCVRSFSLPPPPSLFLFSSGPEWYICYQVGELFVPLNSIFKKPEIYKCLKSASFKRI